MGTIHVSSILTMLTSITDGTCLTESIKSIDVLVKCFSIISDIYGFALMCMWHFIAVFV